MTTNEGLLARRRRFMRAARLSYPRPFAPVRAEGYWLFDAAGRKYLDAYNNVPHVGHCHPRVVAALASQAAILNSNSRYLDVAAIDYAEQLVATMGDAAQESAVIFTCTASEANDLALRIATRVTGRKGVITTRNGYHGNTTLLSALDGSAAVPSKEDWWEPVQAPPAAPEESAPSAPDIGNEVRMALSRLRERGHEAAAFVFDSYFCSDGVRTPVPGMLDGAVKALAEAGAIVIADEVQCGLGRCGSAMWAFQRLGLRPDIVVLGKSLGNGYPIGALVARADLIDRFYSKDRYFNTCAGSQVAAAVGSAVLAVIRDEHLIEHAAGIGDLLERELQGLAARHSAIRAVRGKGLLLGVDLAPPPGCTDSPGVFASRFVGELLEAGVVAGLTGPDRSARTVLKVRPPMPFDEQAVERLIAAIVSVLKRLEN